MPDESHYTPDAALEDPNQDRFRRWPFARRIAETIAERTDSGSLVVGIYGPWGEGKTTVLNFIARRLADFDRVVCVKFNPWLYPSQDQLLGTFFQTLADTLGRKLTTRREEIGNTLKKYGGVLAPVSLGLPGISASPGQAAQQVGSLLSSVDLDEQRQRIEKILEEEERRIVVLMDDLDRLDKTEIQTVFKLVKVAADFKYTAYVLAFDDKMVSSALAERYVDSPKSGASFLEKIVQVPLN